MIKSSVFLINGGAGRIVCAIPALELYEKENPNDDFIIVVEYGIDFFKGHPTLYERCYDFGHKNLFKDKIKDRIYKFPEPYQVWEYYNNLATISQAFDIAINNKGLRPLPPPTIVLSNSELVGSIETVNLIKKDKGNKKTVVFQPFGRGTNMHNTGIGMDTFGKSFFMEDLVTIIRSLQKKYIVILMCEHEIKFKEAGYDNIDAAQITDLSLRQWFALINASDYFLGCDSVGQHAAYSLGKKATVVLGGTFKENVSYPLYEKFDIIDVGGAGRLYSPIRLCYSESADINNEKLMRMTKENLDNIILSINSNI
jgi:ADP-heptose:LPS heptosyltransferase